MDEKDLNQELIRVARILTLKRLSEIYVLDETNVEDIVAIDAFTQFQQSYQYKVEHDLVDMF